MQLKSKSPHICSRPRFDAKFVILKYGEATVPWTFQTHEGELKYLQKSYQVEVVSLNGASQTHSVTESPDEPDEVLSELPTDGDGSPKVPANDGGGNDAAEAGNAGTVSGGDGQPDAGELPEEPESGRNAEIRTALKTLDPMDDEHFTEFGKPMVAAVAQLVPNVTRSEIDAAWPEFNRDLAKSL